jgi:tetratricopeptide (TPR) repeat protein
MDNRSLSSLLVLLDQPILLRLHVASIRERKDLDESVLGFIALYDACAGDSEQIRKHLKTTKHAVLTPLANKKKSNSYLLKYAAIFIVLGLSGIGVSLLMNSNRVDLSPTYIDPGLPNYMGASAGVDLSDALFHRKKKDYDLAKRDIEKVLTIHPTNDTVLYYKAVILFENEETESALKGFRSIAKSRSTFADRANYFIAIQAVHDNHLEKAKRIFKILTHSKDEQVRFFATKHLKALR